MSLRKMTSSSWYCAATWRINLCELFNTVGAYVRITFSVSLYACATKRDLYLAWGYRRDVFRHRNGTQISYGLLLHLCDENLKYVELWDPRLLHLVLGRSVCSNPLLWRWRVQLTYIGWYRRWQKQIHYYYLENRKCPAGEFRSDRKFLSKGRRAKVRIWSFGWWKGVR